MGKMTKQFRGTDQPTIRPTPMRSGQGDHCTIYLSPQGCTKVHRTKDQPACLTVYKEKQLQAVCLQGEDNKFMMGQNGQHSKPSAKRQQAPCKLPCLYRSHQNIQTSKWAVFWSPSDRSCHTFCGEAGLTSSLVYHKIVDKNSCIAPSPTSYLKFINLETIKQNKTPSKCLICACPQQMYFCFRKQRWKRPF